MEVEGQCLQLQNAEKHIFATAECQNFQGNMPPHLSWAVYDICRLQTADRRLQTADCRLQTADRRLQIADRRLHEAARL